MKKCRLLVVLVVLALSAPVLAWGQTPAFVTMWGTYGSGNGQFNTPCGVAAGPGGLVYVADEFNNRIQAFGSEAAPT